MHESDAERREWPAIMSVLDECHRVLEPIYRQFDRTALQNQRYRHAFVLLAAIGGTLAVFAAILQLSRLMETVWPLWVEILAVLGAASAVILGLIYASQSRWLLERHKAERCRLLKFHFLTDPLLWCGGENERAARLTRLRDDAAAIRDMNGRSLHDWIDNDAIPRPRLSTALPSVPPATIRALVNYYQRKRLGTQLAYFLQRSRHNTRLDRLTVHAPPLLFFASIVAALGHFVCRLCAESAGANPGEQFEYASAILIVMAASFPLLGSGIRIYRSAYEFGRNTSRYRAKQVALNHIDASLTAELKKEEPDCRTIFQDLWCSEQILDAEHREWLRLMLDAEWFG